MDTQHPFDDNLPEAGTGHHMRVVQIEYYDTETGDTDELIRVWFKKQPRIGTRFNFRRRDWRITMHFGGHWIAEILQDY